jgi:hypothetical protein
VGKSDCQIIDAMSFAAKLWSNDEVVIHVDAKDARRVIERAVVHNLNIANHDHHIQSLVTAARERLAVRACGAVTRRRVASFERVLADGRSR